MLDARHLCATDLETNHRRIRNPDEEASLAVLQPPASDITGDALQTIQDPHGEDPRNGEGEESTKDCHRNQRSSAGSKEKSVLWYGGSDRH